MESASLAQTRVEVYISGNTGGQKHLSKEEIAARLSNYELVVEADNGKLVARAKPKARNMDWRKALNIGFKVFVPQTVNTELNTSGGSISLANLKGGHKFETSGGSISASDCKGNIKLITSGGSLTLDNLDGQTEAITSGGSIGGHHIRGELTAKTSGGSISLSNLSCSLETGTSAGSVNLQFDTLGKYIKANVSAGNVHLQLPSDKGLNLNLSADKIKTSPLSNFNGSTVDNSIKGTLNGGGIPVDIDAGPGSIRLSWN